MCNESLEECGHTLECGHTFCKPCISQYLTIKVTEAQVDSFVCPFVPDDVLQVSEGDSAPQAVTP